MQTKKTKIIATIGPASLNQKIIEDLIKNGVNVFRFNMKHADIAWHENAIDKVQKVADKLGVPVGVLIDLQGPEIRVKTKNSQDINLKKSDEVWFSHEFEKNVDLIVIPHESVIDALDIDDTFFIDDGFARFKVVKKQPHRFLARAIEDCVVKDNKSMNLFGKDVELPSLIEDDIKRLHLATIKKVDYVALSFTRTKSDINTLKKEMSKKKIDALVVSKIESQKGLDNIDEIIMHSDVIMIARGDLGIETPIEKLAYYQKMIINKCRRAHRPVIVATQMLQSMIENPIPTRAEATDVANAVLDGTDALMLSGETATGKYPVLAVIAMSKIAEFNEEKSQLIDLDYEPDNATELVVMAAESITEHSKKYRIDKIVVFTETGYTARLLSSYRPKMPIIAATRSQKTVEELTLSFGVFPVKVKFPVTGRFLSADYVLSQLKKQKYIKKGERILIIHGQHWNKPGQTNAIVLKDIT